MKATKVLLVLALLSSGFLAFAQEATASAAPKKPEPISGEKNGISYSILKDGDVVTVEIKAKASGWVAVGLDPEQMMKGADFLLGYVKDGVAYARDDYGHMPTGHAADTSRGGKDSLIAFSGEELDGFTTIRFTVAVQAGEETDKSWTKGKHVLLLAASRADNFSGIHFVKAKVEVELP